MDVWSNPSGFYLALGQASDLAGADALLHDTPVDLVITDKTYDAQARVVGPLTQAGKAVVILSI